MRSQNILSHLRRFPAENIRNICLLSAFVKVLLRGQLDGNSYTSLGAKTHQVVEGQLVHLVTRISEMRG